MRLSKKATAWAVICSLPFIILATYSWIRAAVTSDSMLYEGGDIIYLGFGFPLTQILYIFKPIPLADSDNWWAIPLLDALFIFQWVIWGQLFALIYRLYKYLDSI